MSESGLWWLSFADDDGHLGVVLVEASSFLDAVMQTHNRKVNPGGEVQGTLMPMNLCPEPDRKVMDALPRLTLLSRADIERVGMACQSTREME